jgi:tetratricopeptide (TPR) repeat protein
LDAALDEHLRGNYTAALDQFEALEQLPWHPKDIARLRLFETSCLTMLARIDDAHEKLQSVDESELDRASQLDYEFELARLEFQESKHASALERIGSMLKRLDDIEDLNRRKALQNDLELLEGVLLADIDDLERAIPILGSVSAENPGWAQATVRLGDCYFRRGDHEQALKTWLEVVNANRDHVHPVYRDSAIRNIGMVCYYGGDYEKAVGFLSKVADKYDEYPDIKRNVHKALASALRCLGKIDEAAKYNEDPMP